MGTLTYAGDGVFDPSVARADVARCFRRLRLALGGKSFPYMWVPEWHQRHGLHLHFAVGRYVRKRLIEDAWGLGIVHIGRRSIRHGASDLERARIASRYLAKYVSKTFENEESLGGHRYDVAQGFTPAKLHITGETQSEVHDFACDVMGKRPSNLWLSLNEKDWQGPPAGWLQWD